MCKQCQNNVVCSKNKKHIIDSHTIVIFINDIKRIKNHEKYEQLQTDYKKRGCKVVLLYEKNTRSRDKKHYIKRIRNTIRRSGSQVNNVIIYFWENEQQQKKDTQTLLHPNTILGDLSSSYHSFNNKRWFLIATRIINSGVRKSPPKNFGLAGKCMGYLDIRVRNEDESISVLERLKYWDKLDELINICRGLRCNIQHAGSLLQYQAVY